MELDWLKRWNLYSPNAVAIFDGESGHESKYSDFFAWANAGAIVLREKFGIRQGDRIAVLSLNEIEYVYLYYAAQRLGAILVPVNYRLTLREVDHILQDSSPRLIVQQTEFSSLSTNSGAKKVSLQDWTELVRAELGSLTDFVATEDSPAMIIYTSGTTGSPKGAILTHKMLFWNALNTSMSLNVSANDCTVIFLPFFHTGGWNVLTTPFFHRGGKIVLLKKFDADGILKLSETHKATLIFGVPTTMDMMARSSIFASVNLSSVRYAIVGGEPMPIPLIEKWHDKGIFIRQGYGLTEFGPNCFSLHQDDALRKKGSIGFPNFYVDVKIVDELGSELGPNLVGELLLKGPMAMGGYWQNPKATAETLKEGWLSTGDLVRKDDQGYFYVVGRKKDMFKSGGENIYPAELEQVLQKFEGVKEVAVIGVPDEKWGEVGKAFVVAGNSKITAENLQEHCSKNLAKFKIPKYFQFLNELPKGDSGKILKRALAEMP